MASVAAILITLLPVAAAAQYAPPSDAANEEVIRGTITGFDGAYRMYVRDERGYVDTIGLREGTIINPTGIRLAEGQIVRVIGFAKGDTLVASRIDTPLYLILPPWYVYAPPPYAYPPPPLVYPYWGP